jgi:O-succinylbenzoic acid--CoA ligase
MDQGLSILEAARDPVIAARPAMIAEGTTHTFGALAHQVERVVRHLAREGIGPGSRVAFRADCSPATVIAILALLERGATLVPLHPRLTPSEIAVLLEDAAPERILSAEDLDPPETERSAPPVTIDRETPLAILFTSGTTGRPKGAVLPRRAFIASARASEQNLGWQDDDRWLLCMPLAHVGGLSIVTRCLLARRTLVLEPRFDPASVLRAITRERVTLLSVVPTMLQALFEADRDGVLARLRLLLLGGAGSPTRLLEEAAARRVLALTTYGLTEACSQVTCQRPRLHGTAEPGSGHVLPGLSLRIVRDDGAPAAPDEVGRIQVGGPNLMAGYLTSPGQPPRAPLTDDGFFDTGDLGAFDAEGRLFVHARRTDLIVTGGENVYPAEIEQALEASPEVARAVVFGVPDERWGQIVAAGLVMRAPGPDAAARAEAIAQGLWERLATHKRPRLLAVAEALPLTASGKIDRAAARRALTPSLRPLRRPEP